VGWGRDQKWNDDDECLINVQSFNKNELYHHPIQLLMEIHGKVLQLVTAFFKFQSIKVILLEQKDFSQCNMTKTASNLVKFLRKKTHHVCFQATKFQQCSVSTCGWVTAGNSAHFKSKLVFYAYSIVPHQKFNMHN